MKCRTGSGSWSITGYGDSALLLTCDGEVPEGAWHTLQTVSADLAARGLTGIRGRVATFDSLLVEYDPERVSYDDIEHGIITALSTAPTERPVGRDLVIPVVYGGQAGPDLPDVASELGLSEAGFIERHAATAWSVAFLGAPVGAPMLAGSPFTQSIARAAHPRIRVPAGSIAVARHQCVIYPVESPGGWRLIGRTPARVFDLNRDPRIACAPGDTIRFHPITPGEAAHHPDLAGQPW